MRIRFSGAARSVSGSLHVVEVGGGRWLLDCGLFQGRSRDMYDCNARLPVRAESVDGVFLSHAHVDHSGRLPRLVRQGFRGPIYATRATIDLCRMLLMDSAYVLSAQTAVLNQRRERRGLRPLPDLYGEEDVEQALGQMVAVPWREPVRPAESLEAVFLPAGHILGASSIVLRERRQETGCSLAYSGDVGRRDEWVLPDPEVPEDADHVILESTYGDRLHRPYAFARGELCRNLRSTIEAGGKIVIPAFSVGRTQRMIYELRALMKEGELPETAIYLDSPLSIRASEEFIEHPDALRDIAGDMWDRGLLRCRPVVTAEESRTLVDKRGPYIVITASGMCEAGRVLHHLRRNLPDPTSRIVFVGFCAQDTLGRQLIEGHNPVRLLGSSVPVMAAIDHCDAFSAHADQNDLSEWVGRQGGARTVFLVHGEEEQLFSLAERLESEGAKEIVVPFSGEQFELTKSDVQAVA